MKLKGVGEAGGGRLSSWTRPPPFFPGPPAPWVTLALLSVLLCRPRLGALLNRVVGVGLMYLLFSIIEGILRVKSVSGDLGGGGGHHQPWAAWSHGPSDSLIGATGCPAAGGRLCL